jgi:hypothetical protein
MQILNRESWLNHITESHIKPHFEAKGYTIPDNVRLSCSFTSRGAFKKKGQKTTRIGECWSGNRSGDNTIEIMISPIIADSVECVAILMHELVHATVGNDQGHNSVFKQCALSVGLQGKMTATTASDDLKAIITTWLEQMGNYPHAELNDSMRTQSTRMYKTVCRNLACGYTMRISSKWLKIAIPECPACCSTMTSPFGNTAMFRDYDEE